MSRQNKVNPGMYTQRGRLTQDDAARELQNQRQVGAPHTWQHGTNDKLPSFKGSEPLEREEEEEAAAPAVQKPLRAKKQKAAPAVKAKAKSVKKSAAQTKAKAKAKPKATAKTRKTAAKKTPARKKAKKARSRG
jgi:hypothetical protein